MATEAPPVVAPPRPTAAPITGPITEFPVEERWVAARQKPAPLIHVLRFGAPFQAVTKQGQLKRGAPGDYLAVGPDGYPFILTPTQVEGDYEFAESATDEPTAARPPLRPPEEIEQDLKLMLDVVGRMVKDHRHAQQGYPESAETPPPPEDDDEPADEIAAEPPVPPDPAPRDERAGVEAAEPVPPWSRNAEPNLRSVGKRRIETSIEVVKERLRAAGVALSNAFETEDMVLAARIRYATIPDLERQLQTLVDQHQQLATKQLTPEERLDIWAAANPDEMQRILHDRAGALPYAPPAAPTQSPAATQASPPVPPATPPPAPPVSPPPPAPYVGTLATDQAVLIDEFIEKKMVAGDGLRCSVAAVYYGYSQYVNKKSQRAVMIREFSDYLKSRGWKRVEGTRGASMWVGWTLRKLAARPSAPGMSPNGTPPAAPAPGTTPGVGGEAPAVDDSDDVPPPPPAPPTARVGGPAPQ